MILRLLALGVVVAVVALATSGEIVWADDPLEPDIPDVSHPIPGWSYELSYDIVSGQVVGLVGFDSRGSPYYGRPNGRTVLVAKPGQAVVDVSSHAGLSDIVNDVGSFEVDPETEEVRSRVGAKVGIAEMSQSTSSQLPLDVVPALVLAAIAGIGVLARFWVR